jgi:hypothetical protein
MGNAMKKRKRYELVGIVWAFAHTVQQLGCTVRIGICRIRIRYHRIRKFMYEAGWLPEVVWKVVNNLLVDLVMILLIVFGGLLLFEAVFSVGVL